jgi:hypothetical protein
MIRATVKNDKEYRLLEKVKYGPDDAHKNGT